MKKVEAVIRPTKLEEVKNALAAIGVRGMTISDAVGCGLQKGYATHYRGTEFTLRLLPKLKLELVVPDESLEEVIDTICASASTGEVGDGKIFISEVLDAIRIRTRERAGAAI